VIAFLVRLRHSLTYLHVVCGMTVCHIHEYLVFKLVFICDAAHSTMYEWSLTKIRSLDDKL